MKMLMAVRGCITGSDGWSLLSTENSSQSNKSNENSYAYKIIDIIQMIISLLITAGSHIRAINKCLVYYVNNSEFPTKESNNS